MLCNKFCNQKLNKVKFDFDVIKEFINYNLNNTTKEFVSDLKCLCNKMMSISTTIKTEEDIISFILFVTFDVDKKHMC